MNEATKITKDDIDWLWEALRVGWNDKKIIAIFDNGGIISTNYSLHSVGLKNLSQSFEGKDEINRLINLDEIKPGFTINPKLLINAINGFADDDKIKVEIRGDSEDDKFWGLKITGGSGRMAFIAGMKDEEQDE